MDWLTLSSITCQTGFNSSQQRDYFTLPGSRTSDILCVASQGTKPSALTPLWLPMAVPTMVRRWGPYPRPACS